MRPWDSRSMPRILIVDQDREFLEIAGTVFRYTAGWESDTAVNGAQGLYRVGHRVPDAVVCNVMLTDMNGFQFVRRVRSEYPEMPVIFLTETRGLLGLQEAAHMLGIHTVLEKPFDVMELPLRIGRAFPEIVTSVS